VRLQKALRHVSETLVTGARDRQSLLQYSAEQMRKGGHFERLLLGLVRVKNEDDASNVQHFELDVCVEAGFVDPAWPDKSRSFMEQVMQTGETDSDFEHLHTETNEDSYGMSRLYLPIFLDGQLYLIIGVESTRRTPFESKQEEFLNTTGPQLVVALENMRLTEQTAELAAEAERGRIARDIHDGVAQLVYMLSLNTETCAALAHRIAEASEDEEDKEVLDPLAQRLDTLVTISKQALWETRNYMFTLKPLISGSSTLTQMLTNQVREFETISGLSVRLEVVGSEEDTHNNGNHGHHNGNTHTTALVGTAIFRITQEALTNAYKHAEATQLHVQLRHLPQAIEVEICDNGKGLTIRESGNDLTLPNKQPRIYSGHGIRGMRERAAELGGTFEVTTLPDGGVSVKARLPK
jgi:signal transduction histidine kinase